MRLVAAFGAGELCALFLPSLLSVLLGVCALAVIGNFLIRNQHKE
jgi:hypothetical protein